MDSGIRLRPIESHEVALRPRQRQLGSSGEDPTSLRQISRHLHAFPSELHGLSSHVLRPLPVFLALSRHLRRAGGFNDFDSSSSSFPCLVPSSALRRWVREGLGLDLIIWPSPYIGRGIWLRSEKRITVSAVRLEREMRAKYWKNNTKSNCSFGNHRIIRDNCCTIVFHQDFLNMKFFANVIRHCGGFFIRRSFASDKLYWNIFSEFVQTHVLNGESISSSSSSSTNDTSGIDMSSIPVVASECSLRRGNAAFKRILDPCRK